MSSDRRTFLKAAGVGATALATGASALHAAEPQSTTRGTLFSSELSQIENALQSAQQQEQQQEQWDTSWTKKVTGKHKAMFDVPEIRDGVGIYRAGLWGRQYTDVLKLAPSDLSTVIVIRHAAIALAMNSAFWAAYEIGKAEKIKDERGKKWAMANPLLSSASTDMTNSFNQLLLDKQMEKGAIVLGCNMAFAQMVYIVGQKDKLKPADAREKAKSFLVPGVILQPSGIFANVMAEEAGCAFVNAV